MVRMEKKIKKKVSIHNYDEILIHTILLKHI